MDMNVFGKGGSMMTGKGETTGIDPFCQVEASVGRSVARGLEDIIFIDKG